jgi:pimeloyl-ACP methyl ester carboxylesterase
LMVDEARKWIMMRNRILITGLIISLFLAACQAGQTSSPSTPMPTPVPNEPISQTTEPTQTTAPTSTATSPPVEESLPAITSTPGEGEEVDVIAGIQEEIEAADGLFLIGTFYAPVDFEPPWQGVILLHMLWSDRTTWDEYALQLANAGFAVFALDMRGHGETGGEVDWDLAAVDLQQVWDNLAARPDIDPDRMGIVGASIGANMALVGVANEPDARTVILLSPGLSYAGVETKDAMVAFGERPVFIAASQEDTYAADSSRKLHETAVGEARLEMYQDAGHGTFMLENEPELGGQIIEWLQENLQ